MSRATFCWILNLVMAALIVCLLLLASYQW